MHLPAQRTAAALVAILALCVSAAAAGADQLGRAVEPPPSPLPAPDRWIVELDAPPLATYEGAGRPERATAPRATGRKLDVRSADARAWREELDRREDAALSRAGVSVRPLVRYRTAFTGFAARLSPDEAAALRRTSGVRRVVRDEVLRPSQEIGPPAPAGIGGTRQPASPAPTGRQPASPAPTGRQPASPAPTGRQPASPAPTGEAEHLGLPDGLWRRLGGPRHAGSGVVVGVVDSGITPESDSFAQRDLEPPAVWNGACESGEEFPVTSCNDKLIGAREFHAGFDPGQLPEGAFLSPRDEMGHGTHVAGIAAGNDEVDPEIAGNQLGVDRITGIAPAAHVAAYKVCWVDRCFGVDVLAAIDKAVADGVDVLNLSLGGDPGTGQTPDPQQLALLNADAAGVFVAVAAGNFGDFPGAIGTPGTAPWVTTVAATTSPRTFRATVRARGAGGATVEVAGSSGAPAVAGELVDAAQFDTGAPGQNPRYCIEGMTPERVRGKIVLCEESPFSAPFFLVHETLRKAGAAGILMRMDDRADDRVARTPLPVTFLQEAAADRLRRLATDGPATVTVSPPRATGWQPDRAAWFSSRGPLLRAPDLLRPDVTAPGVNVLAAYAPRTYAAHLGREREERFAILSGTSMASPQVAGAGALLTQVHPTWSPAEMRSALVTTARPAVDSDGSGPAPRMTAGAGRIDPTVAADPGLVAAPTTQEYERYAEGLDPESIPGDLEPLAPRDLNMPHLALENAIAPVTVTRTVESVASARASWIARPEGFDAEAGFGARVTPGRFTIAPGQRQALAIEPVAVEGRRTFRDASIVLRNQQDGREVRLPVTMRNPGVTDAPAHIAVDAAPAEGARDVEVTVAGTVSGVAHGLARPEEHEIPTRTEFEGFVIGWLPVEVPEGATLLSAQIPRDLPGFGEHRVVVIRDLNGNGREEDTDPIVSERGEGDDFTRADAVLPEAGKYLVRVFGDAERPLPVPTSTWLVADPRPDDPAPPPGLVAAGDPLRVYPGARRTLSLRWSGVDGDKPLRGVVAWHQGTGADPDALLDTSVVDVTPAGAR